MTDLGYDSAAQAGFAKRYALLDIEERIAVAAQLTGRGGGDGARLVDEAYAAMCRDGALRLADVAPGARLDGRLADVVLRPGDEPAASCSTAARPDPARVREGRSSQRRASTARAAGPTPESSTSPSTPPRRRPTRGR